MIKFGELGAISGGSLACVARSLVKYVTYDTIRLLGLRLLKHLVSWCVKMRNHD